MWRCFPVLFVLSGIACNRIEAIVDPDRPEHFFDYPFPSDSMLDAGGHSMLDGFPAAANPVSAPVVQGWVDRVQLATHGFGNNTAAYFRFAEPLDLPTSLDGQADDPVVWVSLDGSEQLPLELRFIGDATGDPFYADNTLAFAPALGHPPKAGRTYVAAVMKSAGVKAPKGYELPSGVEEALDAAGVNGKAAVATVFTVQDGTGELRALVADIDERWTTPSVSFRRVVRVDYSEGLTPSGIEAEVEQTTYDDGGTELTYLEANPGMEPRGQDLVDGWPMVVYEGRLPTFNYQGLADRPYMSAGLATIGDVDNLTGWIDFEDGELKSVPEHEDMRIVVSIPKGADGHAIDDAPALIWDHGTGGDAYSQVSRGNPVDLSLEFAQVVADAGFALVARDASLYGQRYPLIDQGYGSSLGYYNIVNPPAFRDNERQTAIDGHVVLRFLGDGLNDSLPEGSIDATRVRRGGHSLGSVTSNLGVAAEPDAYESVFLWGSGGDIVEFFFHTGLLSGIDPATLSSLFALFGAQEPETVTTPAVLGAALGLDEAAWDHVDRLHPAALLFQWLMDPADPMAVARDETLPATMLICAGDYQVPNFDSEALASVLGAEVGHVTPTTNDYDPHQCLDREQAGVDVFAEWIDSP